MNALHLENYGVSALETREMREVDGGIRINFFGIFCLSGLLDGKRGNTRFKWGRC